METKNQLNQFAENFKGIPDGSSLYRYISWLNELSENKSVLFKEEYEPIIRSEEPYRNDNAPFMTVITRTQGKRPEMLRETLLSLCAQSDEDFEIILIGHKLDKDQNFIVEKIISEQSENMRNKIRFLRLDHGNRTAPLNFGFAHARGRYISVLDDDDIVLDNWVSEYHEMADKYPGSLLHAYVLGQDWVTIDGGNGMMGLRAAGSPQTLYCKPFVFFRQLRINSCPLMGLCFPSYFFHELGIIFDESLTTTEDWDYLMRIAFLAGVKDIKIPTSIYRFWKNAESSATAHNKSEWTENYFNIQKKLFSMPVIISEDNLRDLEEESILAVDRSKPDSRTPRISTSLLYLNHGSGLNQRDTLECKTLTNGTFFDSDFVLKEPISENISQIRFDICEEGLFIMENIMAIIEYDDGTVTVPVFDDCITNGTKYDDKIFFPLRDPWIMWNTDAEKKLKHFKIIGSLNLNITPELLESSYRISIGERFQLFYETESSPFSEDNSIYLDAPLGKFNLTFPIDSKDPVTALRLDPGESSGCVLQNLKVELTDFKGNTCILSNEDAQINGIAQNEFFVFVNKDPQLKWNVPNKKTSSVNISGYFEHFKPAE